MQLIVWDNRQVGVSQVQLHTVYSYGYLIALFNLQEYDNNGHYYKSFLYKTILDRNV